MENKQEIAVKMNGLVQEVISDQAIGFQRAYVMADAIDKLKKMLTGEYMKPIMHLQNNKLGFLTDKNQGYSEEVVKNVLIEAVFIGVQPYANQFNIISGNCYVTKEGYGYLLDNNIHGLDWEIIPGIPTINQSKSGAVVPMSISWSVDGGDMKKKELNIPVKMNQYMGVDGVIGKATRKSRKWLYERITGIEVPDGDVNDGDLRVIKKPSIKEKQFHQERKRVYNHIMKSQNHNELKEIEDLVEHYELDFEYKEREQELTN